VAFIVPPDAGNLSAAGLDRRLAGWRTSLPNREAGGTLARYPWDLVEHNREALESDWRHWYAERESAPAPPGVTLLGPPDRFRLDPAAHVEPHAVVDTRKGPVLVDRGAVVQAFSRLEGPCYVGPCTQILGARVRGSSFGPECRVGGEVECSILHGYANKAHDGFLGHSYLGEWVNLGAGTHTSDLRVDYGAVRMTAAGRSVDTGLLKVGSFLGDHTKTSIGTLFNTGTTVGAFAQLLTSGTLLPRSVPSFCRYGNGRLDERTDLGQMFATAAVVMARRGRAWTEAHADFFFDLYERTADARRQALREGEQRRLRRVV
jgi:UDP-N-acetylglucosamine diphosphorylase/glucosamine-1-phosphate N-acetyltransferase